MRSSKIVFKNILTLFSKRLIEFSFLFFFNIYIARVLGVEEFGKFSFAIVFTMLFLGLADFGFHRYLNREVAKDITKLKDLMGDVVFLKVGLSFVAFIMMVFLINILGYDKSTKDFVYIFGIGMVLYSYFLLFVGIFRGNQRMDLEFASSWFERPLLVILSVLLLRFNFGIMSIIIMFVVIRFFTLLTAVFLYIKNYGVVTFRIKNISRYLDLFKATFPYGVFFTLGIFYINIDTTILSYMKGDVPVGIYQVVIRFILFLMIIPEVITESVFPRMTEYFYKSKEELEILYRRTIKLLSFFAFPVAAFFIFLNDFIIKVTFGKQYLESSKIMPVVGVMLIFRFLACGAGVILTAVGLQHTRTMIVLICTILTVVFNLLLIPKFSYMGVAVASLIANMFLLAAYSMAVSRRIDIRLHFADLGKFLVSFTAVAVFLYFSQHMNVYMRIITSLGVFVIFTVLFKILTKKDILVLKKFITETGKYIV